MRYFILGFIVNALFVVIVYMDCQKFWGCGQAAETFTLLSLMINFPTSFVAVKLATSAWGKVLVMGIFGTIVNAFIFKSLSKLIGFLFKLGARGIKEFVKDS